MAKVKGYNLTLEVPAHGSVSAEDMGLMFAVDESGKRMYRRNQAPSLIPQQSPGGSEYATRPLDQEINMGQTDFSGGMGVRDCKVQEINTGVADRGDCSWNGFSLHLGYTMRSRYWR